MARNRKVAVPAPVFTALAATLNGTYGAEPRRPNILVIVADDLGYGELGCQGNPQIPTPNIDSLARNGVRFTSGYVSGPYCSPTRAGLMTGRYQQRFGHEFNPGPADAAPEKFGLSLKEKTLADRLKEAGYATGMFGKWHLGYRPEFHPTAARLRRVLRIPRRCALLPRRPRRRREPDPARHDDGRHELDYTTDAFAREAVAFIETHHEQPWFVYLPFNAVHAPLQATEKYLDRFKAIADPKRQTFAAMLSAMDDGVGTVLAKVREHGLEENTLIVFVSDNGGPTAQTTSGNGPLHGFKAQVWEGGIRVPFLVQWKGQIPAGKVYDRPVIQLDILPTVLAAAGMPRGRRGEARRRQPAAVPEGREARSRRTTPCSGGSARSAPSARATGSSPTWARAPSSSTWPTTSARTRPRGQVARKAEGARGRLQGVERRQRRRQVGTRVRPVPRPRRKPRRRRRLVAERRDRHHGALASIRGPRFTWVRSPADRAVVADERLGLATRPSGRQPGPMPSRPRSPRVRSARARRRSTTSGFAAATSVDSPRSVSRLNSAPRSRCSFQGPERTASSVRPR